MSNSSRTPPDQVAVACPVRTPIGKFGGGLSSLTAVELGAVAARGTLRRAGLEPDRIDLVIFGNARQAGGGPNPARQIVRQAGLGDQVPAWTVNQACGSGLRALIDAHHAVALGDAGIVLAGGTESMSRVPYLLDRARWGHRMGPVDVVDAMYRDGFSCPLCGLVMGETAEILAERQGIAREDQDRFAAESQRRCEMARAEGRFQDEIVPVERPGGQGALEGDEHPRDGVTAESLSRLRPVFRTEGTVHAGNASGITDGAAACLVLPVEQARALDRTPAARLVGHATTGVDPEVMGIGPVPAVRRLLKETGISLADVDLVELNEAFAGQVLACIRELDLDHGRLNVNGGAIALGHPIGATGVRIVTSLLHEMERRKARLGMATLCISGGMGMALLFERL
jgi:acetyl-CoA C-acetyltransferase